MSGNNSFDAEKVGAPEPVHHAENSRATPSQERAGSVRADKADNTNDAPKSSWPTRFVDSFRRDPNAKITKSSQVIDPHDGHGKPAGFDHKGAAEATANSGLAHKLKSRHLQMIAIGGSIGNFISTW
jgi:amino acid transporter